MNNFIVTKYPIKTKSPGGPVRICFISDLHNHVFGENNEGLTEIIESLSPDLILIGGDQIVAKPGEDMEAGLSLARELAERLPLYYAPGNHEYRMKLYPEKYGDMYDRFRGKISGTAIRYLEGENADIKIHDRKLHIMGFNMDRYYYQRFSHHELPVSEIRRQLGAPSENAYNILLAHHPKYRKAYRQFGAELTLSGHFHGGVIGLGPHRGLASPNFRLFEDCCRGMYRFDPEHCQIISAGLGEHTIPVRIHNPRELIVIDLKGE